MKVRQKSKKKNVYSFISRLPDACIVPFSFDSMSTQNNPIANFSILASANSKWVSCIYILANNIS